VFAAGVYVHAPVAQALFPQLGDTDWFHVIDTLLMVTVPDYQFTEAL
jgi:hypothetical protein